jgi:hypothetical protein
MRRSKRAAFPVNAPGLCGRNRSIDGARDLNA